MKTRLNELHLQLKIEQLEKANTVLERKNEELILELQQRDNELFYAYADNQQETIDLQIKNEQLVNLLRPLQENDLTQDDLRHMEIVQRTTKELHTEAEQFKNVAKEERKTAEALCVYYVNRYSKEEQDHYKTRQKLDATNKQLAALQRKFYKFNQKHHQKTVYQQTTATASSIGSFAIKSPPPPMKNNESLLKNNPYYALSKVK